MYIFLFKVNSRPNIWGVRLRFLNKYFAKTIPPLSALEKYIETCLFLVLKSFLVLNTNNCDSVSISSLRKIHVVFPAVQFKIKRVSAGSIFTPIGAKDDQHVLHKLSPA